MKNLIQLIFLSIMLFSSTFAVADVGQKPLEEKNYFQFAIPNYHTTRQSGQTVDIYVRYAYKKRLEASAYPDYRLLRTKVLSYMEPSTELPENVFWEVLATAISRELIQDFPLKAISVQLQVHDNPDPERYEPGAHGPVVTIGNIAPLDVH